MNFNEKLKAIRSAERITQSQLAEITMVSISTLKKIEAGYHDPGWKFLSQITTNPRFKKYALWLTTNETAPEIGQISPALSLDGSGQPEDVPDSAHNTAKSPR